MLSSEKNDKEDVVLMRELSLNGILRDSEKRKAPIGCDQYKMEIGRKPGNAFG